MAALLNVFPEDVASVDTRLFWSGEPELDETTFMEQQAAVRQLGDIPTGAGRLIADLIAEPEADQDFDLFEHLTPDEALHAEDFDHADSLAELTLIRNRRLHEQQWAQALEDGPLNPFLAMTLGVLGDPTSYLGFGAGALFKGAALARAAKVGGVVAAETAAGEAVLQASQETRSAYESVAALMMGAAFGGALGALGGKVADRAARETAYKRATSELATALEHEAAVAQGSVGAARVQTYHPSDTELASGLGVAAAVSKLPRFLQAPSLFLMQSSSPLVREAALRLVDIGMLTKGTVKGVAMPQSVDIAIRSRSNELMFTLSRGARTAYREFRKAGGKLSQQRFYEEVGHAMRRDQRHPDPAVTKAATDIRKIFDELSSEAKAKIPDFKMLPEKNGWRYLTRIYRRDKIAADLPAFKGVVTRDLMARQQAADWGDAEAMAEEIASNILGMPADRPHIIMAPPAKRGPVKERVWDIEDRLIEPWLESNIMDVAGRYIRVLSADIEFARAFEDVGNAMDPVADWAPKIRDEAMKAAEAAEPGQRKAILDQADRETEMLRDLVNAVRGVRPPPGKIGEGGRAALQIGRDVSLMRSLGSVTISSLNDIARIQMVEGFGRVYGTLLADMARGFKAIRMGIRQAQSIGDAVDLELNTRSQALFDIDATRQGQTWLDKVSRGSGRMASAFMKATGMPYWNTFWKGVAFTVASNRVLRTAERLAAGKNISQFDRMRMAQSGLTEADLRAIAAEAQHWSKAGSNRLPNLELWGDREVARKVRLALVRDVDDAIITPGAGDAPLWTGADLGKTVFQFKRFGMASTQRTLITGAQRLQRGDLATMGALATMVGLGAVSTILKDIVNKGGVQERSPQALTVDAVDRSGILSLYFEMDGLMQSGIGWSPAAGAAGRHVSRFAGRGPISQAAGPTAGWFEDAMKATAGLVSGDFTQPDLHRFRRLAPFQNHFLISAWLTQLEEASGLPEKQR